MFNRPCELCGKHIASDKHHLFSQTSWARKLYGKLIDDPRNIIHLCNGCHTTKVIPKMNELEFCEALGIAPRSKQYMR